MLATTQASTMHIGNSQEEDKSPLGSSRNRSDHSQLSHYRQRQATAKQGMFQSPSPPGQEEKRKLKWDILVVLSILFLSIITVLISHALNFTQTAGMNAYVKVTGVHVTVSPTSYDCKQTSMPFRFKATIDISPGSKSGNLTYSWKHSDGKILPAKTIPVAAGQTTVSLPEDTWSMDTGDVDGTYWGQVAVSTPNSMASNQATFTKGCDQMQSSIT
jgi:hypothetical protein